MVTAGKSSSVMGSSEFSNLARELLDEGSLYKEKIYLVMIMFCLQSMKASIER